MVSGKSTWTGDMRSAATGNCPSSSGHWSTRGFNLVFTQLSVTFGCSSPHQLRVWLDRIHKNIPSSHHFIFPAWKLLSCKLTPASSPGKKVSLQSDPVWGSDCLMHDHTSQSGTLSIYIYMYIYISRSFSKLVSVYNPHLFFLSVFLCSSIYIYLFDLFVKFLYDFSLYTVISSSTRTWYQNMVPEHACVACVASSSLSPSSPCCLKRAYCKRPAGFLSHPISIFRGTSGG